MKYSILLLALSLLTGLNSYSQEKGKITIRKNVNGEETVIEREFDTTEEIDLDELMEEYGVDIELDLDLEEGSRIIEVIVDEENEHDSRYHFKGGCRSGSKAFLGVTAGSDQDGKGALVGSVIEGSTAEEIGLQVGDVITEFDGEKIFSFGMLRDAVKEVEAGEEVSIKILRDGKKKNLKGSIGEKSDDDIHTFFYEDGEHDFHYDFDSEKLENMLENLEYELKDLEDMDIHLEWDSEKMEEWFEEFSERMQAWSEEFSDSFEQEHSRRTVVIVIEDISAEEADEVNEQAEPKLKRSNDLDLQELRFYPNPGDGRFELNFMSAEAGDLNLMIFDSHGKKVYYEMLGDFEGRYENEIDISRRPAGNYFLQIEQGGKTYSRKIVKE